LEAATSVEVREWDADGSTDAADRRSRLTGGTVDIGKESKPIVVEPVEDPVTQPIVEPPERPVEEPART
jgi:hypothetical protein